MHRRRNKNKSMTVQKFPSKYKPEEKHFALHFGSVFFLALQHKQLHGTETLFGIKHLTTQGILPFCSGGNQPQRTIRGPTRTAQREPTIRPLKTTKAINKESSPKAPFLNQHDSTRREPCQPLFSKGWLKTNGTHVKTDMPHQPDADKRCPPPRFQGWVGGKNSESWVQSQPKVAKRLTHATTSRSLLNSCSRATMHAATYKHTGATC